jgi:ribonuclease III
MPSTTSSAGSELRTVDPRDDLCARLAYRFADPGLLDLALRHRSWCAENGAVESNERLEFLGDAVLGVVVTDHLFRAAPDMSEGVLARHRSELVSAAALASVARSVHLGDSIALGKGEDTTGGREKTSILADGMEAVIGGVYLDGGMGAATTLVLHLLDERMEEVLHGGLASDHKSRLQELVARTFSQLPRYVLRDEGPEHEKHFWARVELDGACWGEGEGRTKKQAEQAAALRACERLEAVLGEDPGAGPTASEGPRGGDAHHDQYKGGPTAEAPATPAGPTEEEHHA